jgi:hypothetical protein
MVKQMWARCEHNKHDTSIINLISEGILARNSKSHHNQTTELIWSSPFNITRNNVNIELQPRPLN